MTAQDLFPLQNPLQEFWSKHKSRYGGTRAFTQANHISYATFYRFIKEGHGFSDTLFAIATALTPKGERKDNTLTAIEIEFLQAVKAAYSI